MCNDETTEAAGINYSRSMSWVELKSSQLLKGRTVWDARPRQFQYSLFTLSVFTEVWSAQAI